MTLREKISHLEAQLELSHSQPHTVARLQRARLLLARADVLWLIPGRQAEACRAEDDAKETLRNLDMPLED